jgi:hypothetical protein
LLITGLGVTWLSHYNTSSKICGHAGDNDKKQIDFGRSDKGTIFNDLLGVVEEKKRLYTDKLWKHKRKDGEVVPLCDDLENVVRWMNKFREVGDITVQYDPSHTALPWAGVGFIL